LVNAVVAIKKDKIIRGTQIVISLHVEGTPKFWAPDV